jgi:hypothetical protein
MVNRPVTLHGVVVSESRAKDESDFLSQFYETKKIVINRTLASV